jgi:hypothetical protein
MKELQADIWEVECDFLCITTNGIVKKDGSLVMGKGIAKEAATKFPDMARELGTLVDCAGNHVYLAWYSLRNGKATSILSFPTKHHFRDKSDLKLIEQSCVELRAILARHKIETAIVLLPRPGCGCGGLDWESQVKPLLQELLPEDNYIVVWKQ